MRKFLVFIFCVFVPAAVHARGWKAEWDMSAYLMGGTGSYLPFWQRTGHDGVLPYSSSVVTMAGGELQKQTASGFSYEAGANLVAYLASPNPLHGTMVSGLVDRLYLSGSWKMLHADVGMKRVKRISVTFPSPEEISCIPAMPAISRA